MTTRIDIRNILVPIDFSPVADNALRTAIGICKQHDATLTLLHVVENRFALFSPKAGIAGTGVLPDLFDNAKESLRDKAVGIKQEHGIHVHTVVVSGAPAYEITNWARANNTDLICIGTHGSSGIRDFLIGSTAYRVIRHSPCPVLTIPGTSPWPTFKKILFPVRLVPHALDKYEIAKPIISRNDPWIHVVGIVTFDDSDGMSEINNLVMQMRNRIMFDSLRCNTDVQLCNDAAKEVHQIAAMEKPDLIVITATVDTSLKDFFLNPFTQDVVNHSRHPVLSIKPGDGAGSEGQMQELPVPDLMLT